MKNEQILYPGNVKEFKDLIWFSTAIPFHPGWENKASTTMTYLNDFERSTSEKNVKEDPAKHDWKYTINTYGFRGNWRLSPNTAKIGFFGCSITFGVGVPAKDIFPTLVEQHYGADNVESLNFGQGGASIQRISKLVTATSNLFDFDAVVITLSTTSRFAVINEYELLTDYVPSHEVSVKHRNIFSTLSQDDLDMYASDAIHWIKAELKSKNIKVLWSTWCKETYKILNNIVDPEDLLPVFPHNDRMARDNSGQGQGHPGEACHKEYADMIIKRLGSQPWN